MFARPDVPPSASRAVPDASSCGVNLAATRDVDEQAALLSGWNQSYAQLSAGPFEGRIEEAWLDGVHLFIESTSRRLMQRGELAPGRLALGLPLALGEGQAVFCGASDWQAGEPSTGAGRYCTFSGADGFEFFTPEGLVMAGLELDRDELAGLATASEQALIEQIGQRASLHHAPAAGVAGLKAFMQGAFEMLHAQPALLGNSAVRGMLRQAALSNALEALVSAAADSVDVSPQRQWKLVAQARERVQQDPETPMTVAMLCQALQVSRRTLQSAFQEVLGMPPAAFLRAVRLAGARRALRTAPTVTEAAAQWGFWHFSHFAQDFRRMFGELPSQAWRRMRQDRPPGH
ncbi:AraC family transcriptional regulator [Sphaerotilus hippei]|uniref:AraC family transcriptional regulator n=1 Tax=Sphaerotilus hippei TaxID=744406 RepID=A0A318H3P3_9BURK|nr:helix-turn-helix domain-containing protein [Sphaerotilus hippei]PXW98176.1 AraC family transcriptional regulator [Sphaerotilus hippei]